MKIITKKQVEETSETEIKVPVCYKMWGTFYKITDKGLTHVFDTGAYTISKDDNDFGKRVLDLVNKGEEIPEYQFNEYFATAIENVGLAADISNIPTLQLQD